MKYEVRRQTLLLEGNLRNRRLTLRYSPLQAPRLIPNHVSISSSPRAHQRVRPSPTARPILATIQKKLRGRRPISSSSGRPVVVLLPLSKPLEVALLSSLLPREKEKAKRRDRQNRQLLEKGPHLLRRHRGQLGRWTLTKRLRKGAAREQWTVWMPQSHRAASPKTSSPTTISSSKAPDRRQTRSCAGCTESGGAGAKTKMGRRSSSWTKTANMPSMSKR